MKYFEGGEFNVINDVHGVDKNNPDYNDRLINYQVIYYPKGENPEPQRLYSYLGDNPEGEDTREHSFDFSKPGMYHIIYGAPSSNFREYEGAEYLVYVPEKDQNVETTTESIPYETKYTTNEDKPVGYEKVTQKGENGEREVKTTTTTINGEPTNNEPTVEKTTIKEPVDEIIEKGTGELTTQTTQNARSIQFKVIEEKDPTLPKGETKIKTPGQNGIEVTTIKQDFVNGKKYGDPRETVTTNQEVINQIVLVGTKEPDQPVEPDQPNDKDQTEKPDEAKPDTEKPANSQYEPKGGHLDKVWGERTNKKEIKDEVRIPKYNGEKPLITIDNPSQIPTGDVPGDHSVAVTVTYPDGSKDYTVVSIHVGNVVTPEKELPNTPDVKGDKKVTTASTTVKGNEKVTTSNVSFDQASRTSPVSQKEIKQQVIKNLQAKYDKPEKEIIAQHKDEIKSQTKDQVKQQKQQMNELPKTGQENSNSGLIASLLAAMGLSGILLRKRNKKESK